MRRLLTVLVAGGAIFAALPAVNSYADDGVSYDSPIANWNSLLCVSVPGASMATAVNLNQYPCGVNGDYNPVYPDQNWTLNEQSHSGSTYVFTIINDHSHLCMSVPGASTKSATVVNQYPCGYYPDQYWIVSQVYDSAIGSYAWEIRNQHSGLCLSVPGASKAATTVLNQYPCGLYPDQYWDIGALDGTTT